VFLSSCRRKFFDGINGRFSFFDRINRIYRILIFIPFILLILSKGLFHVVNGIRKMDHWELTKKIILRREL